MARLTRRGLLETGLAAAAVVAMPNFVLAATKELTGVEKLYVAAATKAFKNSFGDSLTPESIKERAIELADGEAAFNDLSEADQRTIYEHAFKTIINDHITAYQEGFISAAADYVEGKGDFKGAGLTHSDADQLISDLNENPFKANRGNIWDAMHKDRTSYDRERNPAEPMSPLFAAIDNLSEELIISPELSTFAIDITGNLTLGIKTHGDPRPRDYNQQQTVELKAFHKTFMKGITAARDIIPETAPELEKAPDVPFK